MMSYCTKLTGEGLSRYLNKTESVDLREVGPSSWTAVYPHMSILYVHTLRELDRHAITEALPTSTLLRTIRPILSVWGSKVP